MAQVGAEVQMRSRKLFRLFSEFSRSHAMQSVSCPSKVPRPGLQHFQSQQLPAYGAAQRPVEAGHHIELGSE
jgi:hypothetical protein